MHLHDSHSKRPISKADLPVVSRGTRQCPASPWKGHQEICVIMAQESYKLNFVHSQWTTGLSDTPVKPGKQSDSSVFSLWTRFSSTSSDYRLRLYSHCKEGAIWCPFILGIYFLTGCPTAEHPWPLIPGLLVHAFILQCSLRAYYV